ncbi:GPI transamidase component Gpi16 [Peziza echinospora]|nr:GPI transamidase component Gpi16 [Peziza echinospora]
MERQSIRHTGRRPAGVSVLTSLLILFTLCLFTSAAAPDAHPSPGPQDYDESLLLRPLPGNSLLASFVFRTNGSLDDEHMQLFPSSLNQVLKASRTKELHIKFTLGRWNAQDHGAQPHRGLTAGGTGVELWAWVEADTPEEATARWTTLTNALSGLFCASLNFIDSTRTIKPVLSFEPSGHHSSSSLQRLHLLHGALPREPVCTENLTPFIKLLPCKGKMGISTLLDGHKLFDANWQSMSIDVRPVCNSDGDCRLEMEQAVDMVVDIERSLRRRDSPVPKPPPSDQLVCDKSKHYAEESNTCFPMDNASDLGWSITEMFGRPLKGTCPFGLDKGAENHRVCLDMPEQRPYFASVGATEHRPSSELRCFTLPETDDFDLVIPLQTPAIIPTREEPLLYAERTFTGHGQQHGGVQTILHNPSPDKSVEFVYLESLPWFMRPYLHTFTAKKEGSSDGDVDDDEDGKIIKDIYYVPAIDRKRGTQLEVRMVVPKNSTVLVTYDFEKAILRYTEYPPDANRGFDIAPAIIAIYTDGKPSTYIRTTSLLLNLPTPDFSMPYNVIILTSTVIALAFGSIFNLLVRRFMPADEVPTLRKKIAAAFGKLRERCAVYQA